MKAMKKSLLFLLLTAALILGLTGCSVGTQEQVDKEYINDSQCVTVANYLQENIADVMMAYSYDYYASYIDEGNSYLTVPFGEDLRVRWALFYENHGEVVDAQVESVEKDGRDYVGYIVLTGEDGNLMRMTVHADSLGMPVYTSIEEYSDDSDKSLGDKLAEAGGNTLIGLVVVFAILAFLCLIISLMKFVNKIGMKKPKTEEKPAGTEKPVPSAKPAAVRENLVDDKELVAVITAAIAASEQTAPEGFVVRSIRRLNNNKW